MFSINFTNIPMIKTKNAKLVGNFHDYLIQNGSFATTKKSLITENINSCTAGVLEAGDKVFMFHAAPEMQSITTIKQDLIKQINALKKTYTDIKGFICGGWKLNNNNPESIKSFDLYNTIADVLDSLGIKFTMVCGKEKGTSFDNLQVQNSKITLWNENFKNILIDNSKQLKQNEIINVLENFYQFVEKNTDDTLNLNLNTDSNKNLSITG